MRTRIRTACFLLTSLLAAATPALAEVMDKEPTIGAVWDAAFGLAVVALVAGRVHPLLGLGLLFVPNVPFGMLLQAHNHVMGPAIRAEAGMGYIYQTYAANGLVLCSYLIGVALWARRRKRQVPGQTP